MAARQLCWLIVYRDYPYQCIEDCQSPGKSVLKPAVWTQGYFHGPKVGYPLVDPYNACWHWIIQIRWLIRKFSVCFYGDLWFLISGQILTNGWWHLSPLCVIPIHLLSHWYTLKSAMKWSIYLSFWKNWYPIGEIHSTTHPHYMDSVFASIASPLGVSPLYNPCW